VLNVPGKEFHEFSLSFVLRRIRIPLPNRPQ
jgi:hypothetical protein